MSKPTADQKREALSWLDDEIIVQDAFRIREASSGSHKSPTELLRILRTLKSLVG